MATSPNPFAALGDPRSDDVPPPPPQERERGPRDSARAGTRRTLLIAAVFAAAAAGALVVLRAGSGSGAPNLTTLRGPSFTTAYPAGWSLTLTHPSAGATAYVLASNGATLDHYGIPPTGSIGMTITDVSVTALAAAARDPGAGTQDPFQMLPRVTGRPPGATTPVFTVPLHRTSLDGAAGAAVTATYSYQGMDNVQSDVISLDGQAVGLVEVDSQSALAAQGNAALAVVLAHWHWTAQHNGQATIPAPVQGGSNPAALQALFIRRRPLAVLPGLQ